MKIEAPRGTADVLPAAQEGREAIVRQTEEAAGRYGYGRITIPMFEDTQLFERTSGAGSDVVTKEMYTFEDRAGRSMTLRPEATAGIARAYVEHGLHRQPQPVKLFTVGPMFRYAAPQKGRYREFWQANFEAIGSDDPALDAELIELFTGLARGLAIDGLRLELNSIGDRDCRPAYVERLREFLVSHEGELDEDTRRKAATSPLRAFDSKDEAVRRVLANAPTIGESLCRSCRDHFGEVCAFLDAYGISYTPVPTLVRGLDYYTRTVFEFVKDDLGAAQSTICAGGRYDYLIEEIGGAATPGIGWAAGIERMSMSMPAAEGAPSIDAFFAYERGTPRIELFAQMMALRRDGYRCDAEYAGRSEKGQLTQARRLGARVVVHGEADGAVVSPSGEGASAERAPVPISRIADEVRRLLGEAG